MVRTYSDIGTQTLNTYSDIGTKISSTPIETLNTPILTFTHPILQGNLINRAVITELQRRIEALSMGQPLYPDHPSSLALMNSVYNNDTLVQIMANPDILTLWF